VRRISLQLSPDYFRQPTYPARLATESEQTNLPTALIMRRGVRTSLVTLTGANFGAGWPSWMSKLPSVAKDGGACPSMFSTPGFERFRPGDWVLEKLLRRLGKQALKLKPPFKGGWLP
jgi:hypothetical protein